MDVRIQAIANLAGVREKAAEVNPNRTYRLSDGFNFMKAKIPCKHVTAANKRDSQPQGGNRIA
jgi:hypothetical protein